MDAQIKITWFLLILIALLLLLFSGYLSFYLTIFFAVVFNIWVLRKQWLKHAVRLPAQRLKRYAALFLAILGGVAWIFLYKIICFPSWIRLEGLSSRAKRGDLVESMVSGRLLRPPRLRSGSSQ